MIDLKYEMTFTERIEGPLGTTIGTPPRLCWQVAEAALSGPRITASLLTPGSDWIRLEPDGTRRQDQRTQFLTDDGTLILMHYDAAVAARHAEGRQRRFLPGLKTGVSTPQRR